MASKLRALAFLGCWVTGMYCRDEVFRVKCFRHRMRGVGLRVWELRFFRLRVLWFQNKRLCLEDIRTATLVGLSACALKICDERTSRRT